MTIVEELRTNRESGAKRLEAEYKAGLMTLARRFCTDEGDAEELVNRTFAAVVEGIDDYLEQSAFFGWMCQILSNIHAKDIRKKSHGIVVYPGVVPDVIDEDAEDRIFQEIDASLLHDAIENLPKEMQEAIVLHYFTGLSVQKIAKFLAIPEGTVKSRLHYARLALGAKLGANMKKPGGKAVLLALLLCGITALGAAAWNLVVSGESRVASRMSLPASAEVSQQATRDTRRLATGATGGTGATGDSHVPPVTPVPQVIDQSTFSQGETMNKTQTTRAAAMLAAATVATSAAMPARAATSRVGDDMIVVGSYETVTVDIPNDTTWEKPIFVAGTLRKIGAGTLTLRGEKIYGRGRIEVAKGGLSITATGAGSDEVAEPSVLRSNAAMWLDASQNVAGPNGAAATGDAANWFDVRDTGWNQPGFAPSYIYAESRTNLSVNAAFPQIGTDEAGRQFVYFGGYRSGRWAQWRKPDGSKAWIPINHAFVAYDMENGIPGHYLGCSKQESGDEVRYCYYATEYATVFAAGSANGLATYNPVRLGKVFRDGAKISPTATNLRNGPHLIETEAYTNGAPADAFFNFKNYQQSAGSYSFDDRLGGGRLFGVAVFTNRLEEADRILVEQHLLRKWVNVSGYLLPGITVAPEALLTLPDCLSGATVIESSGTVAWTGTAVSLNAADKFAGIGGALSVDAGATVSNAVGAAVAPQPGRDYAADDWGTVSQSSGTSGAIAKTGAGTLAFAGLGNAATFSVTSGEARLRAMPTNAPSLTENCVVNGGFEGIYTGTGFVGYSSGDKFGAWTATPFNENGATRISHKNGWKTYQWYGDVQAPPEGNYYLLLKQGAGVTQSVTLPEAGRYEITMRVFPRSGDGRQPAFARVYVDDFAVGTVQGRYRTPDWDCARLVTPWLAAGEHELKIVSEYTFDLALGIDDVRMVWLDGDRDAKVANGNFEDPNWMALSPDRSQIEQLLQNTGVFSPAYISGWNADGEARLVRRSPYMPPLESFICPENAGGCFSALLTNGVSLTQTVTIPVTGCYRLSALVCRFNRMAPEATGSSGSVTLALGTESETFSVKDWTLAPFLTRTVLLTEGDEVSISVLADNMSGAVNNIAVDDVRLIRDAGNLVANGGFEGGGVDARNPAGWTVLARSATDSAARSVVYEGPHSQFGNDIAEGNCRARLHAGDCIGQTIPLTPGLYRLSFWEVSRCSGGSAGMIPYSGPAPIRVTLASGATTNFCARVMPSTRRNTFLRHEYLVRVTAAGDYALVFEGEVQSDPSEDKSSFIDAVCLAPVRNIAADAAPTASQNVAITVATGAKIGLDWPGTMKAETLSCAGRSLEGTVTAEDCPDALDGIGEFDIKPKATFIIFK